MDKSNLQYYVYVEDSNRQEIKKYNVLNAGILAEIKKKLKDIGTLLITREDFEKVVDSVLLYYYWCRSEWEVVITDWPTHITKEEVIRLNNELEEHYKNYNCYPLCVTPNLKTEEKISVYDQVKLNWDIFINYLWEGLDLDA